MNSKQREVGMEFQDFGKIARLSREIIITEKIDGTNAQVAVWDWCKANQEGRTEDPPVGPHWLNLGEGIQIAAGSRNRYITPDDDNFGFARWVWDHAEELVYLGHGRHYGEWWGQGIQRGYGLTEKRWSLFNVHRWTDETKPECCHVVPILARDMFTTTAVLNALDWLQVFGSRAAPGFMNPEGVIVYHTASNQLFKKTLIKDEVPKALQKEVAP